MDSYSYTKHSWLKVVQPCENIAARNLRRAQTAPQSMDLSSLLFYSLAVLDPRIDHTVMCYRN